MTGKPSIVARAVRGASAGCLIGLVTGGFLLATIRGGDRLPPGYVSRSLGFTATVGACLGAVFGVTVGGWKIRGRFGSAVQGSALGATVGVPSGVECGLMAGLGKGGVALGIVLGGASGAVVGGLIGAYWGTTPAEKTGIPNEGVRDRDFDG